MANRNKVVVKGDGTSEVIELTDDEQTALDAQEKAWADAKPAKRFLHVREVRDRKLAETDWVVTKALEAGTAVDDAWKSYRQNLRDFPATLNNTSVLDEENITWPTKPS